MSIIIVGEALTKEGLRVFRIGGAESLIVVVDPLDDRNSSVISGCTAPVAELFQNTSHVDLVPTEISAVEYDAVRRTLTQHYLMLVRKMGIIV